jgi:hypothetical protein
MIGADERRVHFIIRPSSGPHQPSPEDELLTTISAPFFQIRAEARDPIAVQPFVKKCFEAVKELVFAPPTGGECRRRCLYCPAKLRAVLHCIVPCRTQTSTRSVRPALACQPHWSCQAALSHGSLGWCAAHLIAVGRHQCFVRARHGRSPGPLICMTAPALPPATLPDVPGAGPLITGCVSVEGEKIDFLENVDPTAEGAP